MIFSSKVERDGKVLSDMITMLEELLAPLRFLADLDAVWDTLNEADRNEIENSRVFKDRDHQTKIAQCVEEIRAMTQGIKGFKYRKIRLELLEFLDHCHEYEPDRVKVIQARIRAELDK